MQFARKAWIANIYRAGLVTMESHMTLPFCDERQVRIRRVQGRIAQCWLKARRKDL